MRARAGREKPVKVARSPPIWRAIRRAAAPLGELCCALLFERSLVEPVAAMPNRLEVSIRQAGEDDLETICRLYAADPWLWLGRHPDDASAVELYRDRLRRGERCYLAFAGAELAHINWTCYRWGDALPGRPLRLARNEVYTTDALTPAAFRGRGIHALVLGRMLADAQAAGAQHAYTMGQLDRADAHKGLHALGWREIGRVVYFQPRGRPDALILLRAGDTAPLFRAVETS